MMHTQQHHSPTERCCAVLQQLNIDQRRVITLSNPLLPAGVPLQRPELWYPLPVKD